MYRLNPCCSGRWSRTAEKRSAHSKGNVLILIVVEDGLVLAFCHKHAQVVMSLNPCCSGRWSRTAEKRSAHSKGNVLILVVMDDGLVRKTSVKFITIH